MILKDGWQWPTVNLARDGAHFRRLATHAVTYTAPALAPTQASMLFTTAVFACLFLPVVWIVFFTLGRTWHDGAAGWLFLASLFFYGWWIPEYTLLLLGSICGNYYIGRRIARSHDAANGSGKAWMIAGIAANLALLGYYKYANFFVGSLDSLLGTEWRIGRVILPIGISFFTFTQIAFLADSWQKGVREVKFIHYGLFVTYFPHLIAGPVLHHAQMMPQFRFPETYRVNGGQVAAGLAIFALGLVKKVVFADGVAPYADAVFNPADAGHIVDAVEGWIGALAYTLQLYFDFSGYSDMAIGLSWMFNVRLPFNFNSPYRAADISDFWRRWHMTLSAFLRDYLYVPLGGNRKGRARRYLNLMVTMLLGGLWHGASWTFVFWGGLHGLFLAAHQGWRALLGPATADRLDASRPYRLAAWAVTLIAVIVAWVFFRAVTFDGALRVLHGMAGLVPAGPEQPLLWNMGLHARTAWIWCAVLGCIALLAPNSNRLGSLLLEYCRRSRLVAAFVGGMALTATLLLVLVNTLRDSASAFIYFNF